MNAGNDLHIAHLIRLTKLIAGGNYHEIDSLLALTAEGAASPEIAELAESFGHMVVQLEARQWQLELLIQNLLEANLTTLEVLGTAVAKRDSDTGAHNYRVTIYAVWLAQACALEPAQIRALIMGAFLHDVGKIAIPDAILLKPGRLDEAEFAIMRTHVQHGLDIIGRSGWLNDAQDVVSGHHEKYDGSGYPLGLKGAQIPLLARIFALVDVFDALTSRRPYKEPIPVEQSLLMINQGAGSHFDPDLAAAFAATAKDWYETLRCLSESALSQLLRSLAALYFQDQS